MQSIRDAYHNDPHQAEIKEAFDHLNKIQEETMKLNKEANYHTQPLSNLIDFYGWKDYVPLKGNPHVSIHDDRFERQGKRVGGEFNEYAEKAEGRDSDSISPILQTVADAGHAASRAGRAGITQTIKNMIDQGHINGRLQKTVTFLDRYNGLTKEDIQGENKVFHYKDNGDIDILSLKDPKIVEAIKGYTNDVGKFWKGLNAVTSAVGSLHTRYNPAFGPYNMVRHMMTSGLMVGAERGGYFGGPMSAAQFISVVATKIATGGLYRAGRIALALDDAAKLNSLATKHSFYKDAKDYLDIGGRTEYFNNFNIKNERDTLLAQVGTSRVIRTADQVKKFFDIYNNTFELAGRISAFGQVKSNIMSRYRAEGRDFKSPEAVRGINIEAAAYSKNLFNYEQTGKYGREAGALYMFLRPALTTATRSINALSPAFDTAQSRVSALPDNIRNDPEAVKRFIQDFKSKQQSARAMMATMIGSGIALYHVALLSSEKDEEGRNKVADDDMGMWTRNIRMPIGFAHDAIGKENDYLQIPWGFGLGSFGALGAQLGGVMEGHNSLISALTNMIPIALDSYMPLPVPKFDPVDHPLAYVIDSIVPAFARPFIEYGMNVDEFGRKIYNDRVSPFGDAYTGGDHLPEMYSAITKYMADATNQGINISPSTVHFFANSYLDGVSRIAHDGFGIALTAEGKKDFDAKRDIPILDSFIGKSSSYDTREFTDVQKEVVAKQAKLQMLKDRPEQFANYIDKHPNDQMIVSLYTQQVNGILKEVNKQIHMISADDSLSPKEKNELLKEMRQQRDFIYRGIIDTVRDYDK
jgi:hypothetical protein